MKIEIAKEGRMDMSGQGLIRAIQNNNMPLLDLFVRESVQNSLDAAKRDAKCVKVDFGVRSFNNSELAENLEGITDSLNSKYGNQECKYLFVRDRETEGLTGPLHFTDKKTVGKKNLLNLVYEIAKPQENAGAGGSWGYGKTVYFRMGIGLVLYYSRILDSNGKYQSRLAACLVEDEKKSDALLSSRQLDSHRGLAWWGREFNYKISNNIESGTIPETNEKEIAKILKVFNFESFIGNETGTAIIIPYINEEKLLKNNITAEGQDAAPWASSLKSYIKIAVQRWYIGRLNNPDYTEIHKQAHLKVSIDGEDLEKRIMAKPFKEIQKLYNLALKGESSKDNYYCETIKINNYFESTIAGHVAYKMFSPEEMEMTAPTNNPSPFVFVKNEDGEDDYKDGDIILTFFRKPGMAVTYDTGGEWVNKIKCNNEKTGDTLIAVFVLNSKNKFDNSEMTEYETIEDYFRAGERADHNAWYDISVNDNNPKILHKIQGSIKRKINAKYKEEEQEVIGRSSSLSKLFGDVLLPPQGFGRKAVKPQRKSGGGTGIGKGKNVKVTVIDKSIRRDGNVLTLPITFEAKKPVSNAEFYFDVAADGTSIPLANWKNKTNIDVPFEIENIHIKSIQVKNKKVKQSVDLLRAKKTLKMQSLKVGILHNDDGVMYGVSVTSDYEELLISMEINIKITDVMAQMKYRLKEGE